jgi:hypothetical protein
VNAEREWVDRSCRKEVKLKGYIQRSGFPTAEATLTDLSYDGCRVETSECLVRGDQLTVGVPRLGKLDGVVRWFSAGCGGVSFLPSNSDSSVEVSPSSKA